MNKENIEKKNVEKFFPKEYAGAMDPALLAVYEDIERLKKGYEEIEKKIEYLREYLSNEMPKRRKVFYEGQIFDAYLFLTKIIESAEESIILIDDHADIETLNLLSKKKPGVAVTIYSPAGHQPTRSSINAFNQQYPSLVVKTIKGLRDKYLIIDDKYVYLASNSLAGSGRSFSMAKLEDIDYILEFVRRLDEE